MLGQQLDQQTGTFKIAPALQVAQSQRQDGLADFREHEGLSNWTISGVRRLSYRLVVGGDLAEFQVAPRLTVTPKKDAGPTGPASQTGRLHVWETWDHEDPEFRTRSEETARVEDLSANYAPAAGLLGGKIGTLACESRMPFRGYAILHLMTVKNVSQPPCAAGNRGTRGSASKGAAPRDRRNTLRSAAIELRQNASRAWSIRAPEIGQRGEAQARSTARKMP